MNPVSTLSQGVRERLARFRRWLRTPPSDLSHKQRTLRWWVDLARHCAGELRRDRASQMAAALTYHTLFSLLPISVLVLVVLHSFVGEADRAEFKETVVTWALRPLQQAEVVIVPEMSGAVSDPDTLISAPGRRGEFEEVRQTLAVRLQEAIDSLETVNFGSIGAVGVLIFIFAATGLLSTIERSFNTIYGAAQGRPAYLRLPLYYTVITLAPIVVLAGQLLQRRFFNLLESEAYASWLAAGLGVLLPILSSWIVLLVLYTLLPNTRVSLRMALVGSFAASILWVGAIQLFTLYVQRAAISTLYGALGLLPLFLFWLWITWVIILFGLELTYALQAMREGRFRYRSFHDEDRAMIDRTVVLPLVARVGMRFEEGRLCDTGELSRAVRLPPDMVDRILRPVVDAGILRRLREDGREGYALARPADRIPAMDVLRAVGGLWMSGEDPGEDGSLDLLDEVLDRCYQRLDEMNVAELQERLGDLAPRGAPAG